MNVPNFHNSNTEILSHDYDSLWNMILFASLYYFLYDDSKVSSYTRPNLAAMQPFS